MNDNSQTGAAKPNAEPASNRSEPAANLWWLLASIALVAWSCLRFPQAVLTPLPDPSWAGVLIHAHEKGMQFGRDIVFTYGPLGFLSVECFSPHAAVARILFELTVGFGIATGLCLLAWRISLPWRIAFLGFFILVASPLHWGGDALFLDLGLFGWGLVCFLESGARLRFFVLPLAILAAIGALVKFTFLVTGLFTVALLACDIALRGRRALAAGLVISFVLAFMLGWTLLGQSFSGLGAFLTNSYSIASGYNEAMGLNDINASGILIITVTAFAAATIRIMFMAGDGANSPASRRLLLLGWTAGLLFTDWKYGCVRTDYDHVAVMLGFMPLVVLGAEAMPASRKLAVVASRVISLACIITAFTILHTQIQGFFPAKCVKHAFINMAESFTVLTQPARYLREQTGALHAEQTRDLLPKIQAIVGQASVDVFGQNQGFALLNELNYRTRPVFQSYTAYNRQLMELNAGYYLGQDAPEFVLFNLQALDNRFPPLEDALVLRNYFVNYEPVASEADYLLLRRKSSATTQLTVLKEGDVRAGEKIDLREYRDLTVWLEIELRPTWLGQFQEIFYKLPQADLMVWSRSEPAMKFSAPACMLSAGFLASPIELNNKDVFESYTAGATRRAEAYSIELPPNALNLWQPEIHFRLYRVQPKSVARAQ